MAASNRSMPAEDSTVAHNLSFCVCSSNIDHYKTSLRVCEVKAPFFARNNTGDR